MSGDKDGFSFSRLSSGMGSLSGGGGGGANSHERGAHGLVQKKPEPIPEKEPPAPKQPPPKTS